MDYKTFINGLNKQEIDNSNVQEIKKMYSTDINAEVASVISCLDETVFFDSDGFLRLLSFQEVLDAEADFNVVLVSNGILPLFDLGDNDYLSFDFSKGMWCKFNIVDEIGFAYKSHLSEYNL